MGNPLDRLFGSDSPPCGSWWWNPQGAGPGLTVAAVVAALVAIACAIVAIVLLIALRRRRRPEAAKPPAEGRMGDARDRFRLLVEGVKDYALILLDPDGLVTSWNPGAERITGFAAGDILGHSFSSLFPPEQLAAGEPWQLLRQAAREGRIEYEGPRVRKDGSTFLIHEVITAFHDPEGRVQGFAKVARDITEQRAHQTALRSLAESLEDQVKARVQELRASEARLQGFIRHASSAIAFKGLDGRFLMINPRMEALINRPALEILGRTNEELFPEEACALLRRTDERVLKLREEVQEEETIVREDGSHRHLLVQKFPLVDISGTFWGMGIISTDITERKLADLALLQSQKLESLGVLTGGIAHDFNNLLGAMAGNVELAMAEATLEGVATHLEILKGLMGKAGELLRQMLVYAGKGRPQTRAFDLNHLVADMTQLLETSVSKKAEIRLELHPQTLVVRADPSQVQQVVMNLIINASEALDERNGEIRIRTGLEDLNLDAIEKVYEGQPLRPGRHVALEIADTGAGMAPEVMKKIFDPFFTTKFAGRGLGLAAIHGIVRAHKGGIQVRSEPGRGSIFKLLLPAAPEPPAPEAPGLSLSRLPAGNGQDRGTILVVDDQEEMRAVAVKALARQGYRILQAGDGNEALSLFRQFPQQIRLILMDLTMPCMDGLEACRELRRCGVAVPVILTSGFSEAEALRRFDDLDLAGFLQKPFELGVLVERVRMTLTETGH